MEGGCCLALAYRLLLSLEPLGSRPRYYCSRCLIVIVIVFITFRKFLPHLQLPLAFVGCPLCLICLFCILKLVFLWLGTRIVLSHVLYWRINWTTFEPLAALCCLLVLTLVRTLIDQSSILIEE